MSCASRAACLLLVWLALLNCVQGQLSAQQIVQAIEQVTAQSDSLRTRVEKIDALNAALEGRIITPGIGEISIVISKETNTLQNFPSNEVLGDADAQLVVDALTTFVQVQQALLGVLIGKHGLVGLIPYFAGIHAALESLESSLDNFAFSLIARIPTRAAAAKSQYFALTRTLNSAIQTYSRPL